MLTVVLGATRPSRPFFHLHRGSVEAGGVKGRLGVVDECQSGESDRNQAVLSSRDGTVACSGQIINFWLYSLEKQGRVVFSSSPHFFTEEIRPLCVGKRRRESAGREREGGSGRVREGSCWVLSNSRRVSAQQLLPRSEMGNPPSPRAPPLPRAQRRRRAQRLNSD